MSGVLHLKPLQWCLTRQL